MPITVFYDSLGEQKSQVFVLIIQEGFHITWHYMEQEGTDMNVFHQSRALTELEYNNLWKIVNIESKKYNVPRFILELLDEHIEQACN